jgi:putative transposase
VVAELGVSERRACLVLGQHRSTQRKIPTRPDDEAALTADIVALATRYGRYGYRRITAMLHRAGWVVNRKRVERIWRREGLKVPHKQPKRECLTIRIGRKLKAVDVIDTLSDLFMLRGVPGHIRSDNGPEFVAKAVREWIAAVGRQYGPHHAL